LYTKTNKRGEKLTQQQYYKGENLFWCCWSRFVLGWVELGWLFPVGTTDMTDQRYKPGIQRR
jgi:hypothetical protein